MTPSITLFGALLLSPLACLGMPVLSDPSAGSLELVVADPTNLPRIDGLAFDSHGNLFGALETAGSDGGIVTIDKQTGAVTNLSIGVITGAEGIAFGDFGGQRAFALYAAETLTDQIIRIDDQGTVQPFGNPSAVGLSRPDNLDFGPDGLLYVAEDRPGDDRIIRITADGVHSVFAEGFSAPAGVAIDPLSGDLYIAEQATGSVWRIDFNAVPVPPVISLLLLGLAQLRKRRKT